MKETGEKLLWIVEPLLGKDGKPSLRNIAAIILLFRLVAINECAELVNGTYITTLALLITGLLGLKVADHFVEKMNERSRTDN